MGRQYQRHSHYDEVGYSNDRSRKQTGQYNGRKNKKHKKGSGGFMFVTLCLAVITFFVCLAIGMVIGPNISI